MVLRGIIDNNRQQGRKIGHFLLLGSASMDLLRQSSESLAGRIRYIEMCGLNLLEAKIEPNQRHDLWTEAASPLVSSRTTRI
jgi:predicted AAA+ superfamily ATPase